MSSIDPSLRSPSSDLPPDFGEGPDDKSRVYYFEKDKDSGRRPASDTQRLQWAFEREGEEACPTREEITKLEAGLCDLQRLLDSYQKAGFIIGNMGGVSDAEKKSMAGRLTSATSSQAAVRTLEREIVVLQTRVDDLNLILGFQTGTSRRAA
jgi:hypothetical protein